MKIILLEKVSGLGNLGDVVNVKSGYARNYLLPTGRATEASEANLKRFEERRAELEKQQAVKLAEAQQRAEKFNGKEFTIAVKAGDEGKLFGSIGSSDIVAAAEKEGLALVRSEIALSNGNIREVGEYQINLHFFGDAKAEITLKVVAL